MSNALYNLAAVAQEPGPALTPTQTLDQPIPDETWLTSVFAVGIVLAAVWIIRRIVYPRKFSLANTPGRGNRIHPAHIAAIFLGWQLLIAAGHDLLPRFMPELAASVLGGALAGVAVLICMIIVANSVFDLGAARGMGLTLRRWRSSTVRGIVACLIALPICWGLVWLTKWVVLRLGMKPDAGHPLIQALREAPPAQQLLLALYPVLLAPLAEEVFFRGMLQSMIRQYTRRPWVGILIVSPLFAAVHASQWTAIPALLFLAIVLGYNYERTGKLLPCIIAHAGFNAIFVLQAVTS